jgi:predicted amidophosphoribosyltransferase
MAQLVSDKVFLLRPSRKPGEGLTLLDLKDCRGLCPQCGADLNREGHRPGCEAVARKVDPRLAKLKELL